MNLLLLVAQRSGVAIERIFFMAYSYYEVRVPKKKIAKEFGEYYRTSVLPPHVFDFCLDVLAGRAKIPRVRLLK